MVDRNGEVGESCRGFMCNLCSFQSEHLWKWSFMFLLFIAFDFFYGDVLHCKKDGKRVVGNENRYERTGIYFYIIQVFYID